MTDATLNRARVKFDHLKAPRNCPVWSKEGFNLSHEPLSDEDAAKLNPFQCAK